MPKAPYRSGLMIRLAVSSGVDNGSIYNGSLFNATTISSFPDQEARIQRSEEGVLLGWGPVSTLDQAITVGFWNSGMTAKSPRYRLSARL